MSDSRESGKSERRASTVDGGLILLDRSLKIVAMDRGASSILKDANQPGMQQNGHHLPKEVLDSIRQCKLTALSSLRIHFRINKNEYMCRTYLMEWLNWLASQPIIAVHLDKLSTSNDAVHDITTKYQLTGREQEVLRGVSLGLSSKTIAYSMDISPNTVKAFLRLIMIKMGVTSRSGIVATMLQNRASLDKRAAMSGIPPGAELKELSSAKSATATGGGPMQQSGPANRGGQ